MSTACPSGHFVSSEACGAAGQLPSEIPAKDRCTRVTWRSGLQAISLVRVSVPSNAASEVKALVVSPMRRRAATLAVTSGLAVI
tara:strand:- start:65 stop:316 length:252 start_codon:yes stop_codon:yes gene_type:complete